MMLQPQHEATGKQVIEVVSHSTEDVSLVLEFIYGAGLIGAIEDTSKRSFIVDCVDTCRIAQEFNITGMEKYATDQLGIYLNTKLKEICVFP